MAFVAGAVAPGALWPSRSMVRAALCRRLCGPSSLPPPPPPPPPPRQPEVDFADDGGAVVIRHLTVLSPEIAAHLAALPSPNDRAPTVLRALDIGFLALTRASQATSTDYVRAQIHHLLRTVEADLTTRLPSQLNTVLTAQLGPRGPLAPTTFLAPLRASVDQAAADTRARLNELRHFIASDIDPRHPDSTLARALSSVSALLDPDSPASVHAHLTHSIASLSTADGALSTLVARTVADAVKPLATEVDRLSRQLGLDEQAAQVRAQTPLKGLDFENDVLATVRAHVGTMAGATVEHVGGDSRPGDVIVRVPLALTPNRTRARAKPKLLDALDDDETARIVIETRDRVEPFGRKRVGSQMNLVLAERECRLGVFLSRTGAGLAIELGEWAEGVCEHGVWVATTELYLPVAIRFLVLHQRLNSARDQEAAQSEERRKQVDIPALYGQMQSVRTALRRVTTISRHLTSLRQSIDHIESESRLLKTEVNAALDAAEENLSSSGSGS